jgi:hypothetical protein
MPDRKQVGIVEEFKDKLVDLNSLDYFENEQDVYRLAVAVAIARGMEIKESLKELPVKTMWRAQDDQTGEGRPRLDDSRGTMAEMIQSLAPQYGVEPYRNSQYLATMGIGYLHKMLIEKGSTLYDAIKEDGS